MDFEGDIPPGEPGGEVNTPKSLAAHMEILDRGEFIMLEREADMVNLDIEGQILNGVYLTRAVRLKGRDRWLFWKGSTD